MNRIKPPFPYFGSKGRFYKEIREIFINNYRDNFIDIFAGAMEIPLSLKNEFKDLKVTANVKDEKIESLLKLDPLALHQKSLFGFGGSGENLGSSFYSGDKLNKLRNYIEIIKTIEVTTEMFNENNIYNNSFIFLDPPYIQKTAKKDKKFIGYNYATNKGLDWSTDDDIRLIQFIKNNLNRNNVFLVFGSIGNNLSELLKENFKCEFIEKEYNHSTFGKSTVRSEYFCLIKD